MSKSRFAIMNAWVRIAGPVRSNVIVERDHPTLASVLDRLKRKFAEVTQLLLVPEQTSERLDLYAIMTLLLLLLYSSELWHVRLAATVLAVLAFVFSSLRRNAKFWFIVAAVVLIGNWAQWSQVDNHKYLLGYWCFAFSCSLQTGKPEKSLATAARCLIGSSFLFAVFWKVTSGDYLDGSFFQHALLSDDRFRFIAWRLGGVSGQMAEVNAAARQALVNYDSHLTTVQLLSTPGIVFVGSLMTWWTILIEALVTTTFLWPPRTTLSNIRDFFLLIFILSTYAVAAVIGFGWVLVIMGLAQCTERFKHMRLAYVLAFVLLQVYRFHWSALW